MCAQMHARPAQLRRVARTATGIARRAVKAGGTAAALVVADAANARRAERRHPLVYSPAAARSRWALSVRSQVNSGSSRPKCPYAAVFA
jgi:hypothetical protein